MKSYFTLLISFFSTVCFGQSKDTVYLLNQTTIIGELKNIKLGRLYFDADGIGDITIKYNKIKTFRAGMHAYRVETADKKIHYGTILSTEKPGMVLLQTKDQAIELTIGSITYLYFYGQSLGSRLSGNLGIGYSYTKSSDIGRLNLNGTLVYVERKVQTKLNADMILTSDSNKTTRERENLNLSCSYLFDNSLYVGAVLSYQRNINLGLLSRWQEGAGLGYKFARNQHSSGEMITGPVVNQEKTIGKINNNTIEWAIEGTYSFFSFSQPNITVSTTQSAYFSFTQKGRIRQDGNIRIDWEMIKDFSLNLNFYHNYDRKSPATNNAKTDFGFVAGLNYKF